MLKIQISDVKHKFSYKINHKENYKMYYSYYYLSNKKGKNVSPYL